MNADPAGVRLAARPRSTRLRWAAYAAALLASACTSLKEIVSEGPVDGSAARTFVFPAVFRPVVTVARSTRLALEGEPLAPDGARTKHLRTGANRFELVIEGVEAVQVPQCGDEWCWAACAQMVNAHRGRPLISRSTGLPASQEELARYYKGGAEDQTANLALVIRSLAPELEARLCEQRLSLGTSLTIMSTDALIEGLSRGELAVIGLRDEDGGGHACVAIGVEYSWVEGAPDIARELTEWGLFDPFGGLTGASECINALAVHELKIYDPWAEGSARVLSGDDLAERCAFILNPTLAREILTSSLQVTPDALGELMPTLRR